MCFDTTSVNTGWLQGAAVRIEAERGIAMWWLPCRHHIPELFVKEVYTLIFGEDRAPEILQFKHFQVSWDSLDKTKFSGLGAKRSIVDKRNEVVRLCQSTLQGEKMIRDD